MQERELKEGRPERKGVAWLVDGDRLLPRLASLGATLLRLSNHALRRDAHVEAALALVRHREAELASDGRQVDTLLLEQEEAAAVRPQAAAEER